MPTVQYPYVGINIYSVMESNRFNVFVASSKSVKPVNIAEKISYAKAKMVAKRLVKMNMFLFTFDFTK